MGTAHCLGMWCVPFSLRVGTQSHSFIQSPIQSLHNYLHMLDICKCSCIFRRKKLRKNGRKERRKGRKGERKKGREGEGGKEGERESRLEEGLTNVQTTKYSRDYPLDIPLSVCIQRHLSNLGPMCSRTAPTSRANVQPGYCLPWALRGCWLPLRTVQGLWQISCCYAEPCTSSRCYTFFKHLI